MKRFLHISLLIIAATISSIVFAQPATLVTNPVNGHYCQGSAGVQILMEHSVNGTTYNLRRQGQIGNLATLAGNGNTITFPGFYPAGTYVTVPVTNSVTVVMDPIPAMFIFSATNNGAYCNYPGTTGVELLIQPTQPGINYVLFRGITPLDTIAGSGGQLSFGFYSTQGSYRVSAYNPLTGCSRSSVFINVVAYNPPDANFHSDNDTPPYVCASTAVTFTSTSTGSGLTYFWNFNDLNSGNNDSAFIASPSHIFEAFGNTTQTFGVLLKVTDIHGCMDTITRSSTVIQKPDATLHENLWLPNANFPNTFAACDASLQNPVGAFEFVNASTTQPTNTWYNINWGNAGIPTFNQATFDNVLAVTYTTSGYSTLTYTINGLNGCNNTKLYNVFVGNFAGGGLGNPGNTAGVADFCIDFPIQPESYDNPPGTKFNFEWGDGTTQTILREDLPSNGILNHCYTSCSSVLQGTPEKYGFKAMCNTENPCGSIQTSVWPIVVSCKAQANFASCCAGGNGNSSIGGLFGGNGADTLVGCNDVTFTDSTQIGFYIIPPGYNTFTTNTFYSWNFGDPASGTNNTSTLPNPTHHFTTSATWYTVTMIAYTGTNANFNSGRDTVINQIYIQTPPLADFDVFAPDTCSPIQVLFTDLSTVGGWGVPAYRWRVNPTSGWSIITPGHVGDSTYHSPIFEFTAVGSYNVKLVLANSCDISEKDTTILVCQPPQVAFTTEDIYLCGPGVQNFGPAYDMNCDTTLISYHWHITPDTYSFVDGTNANSKYPHISFADFADYEVKSIITNSCGSDSTIQNVHITQLITNNLISPGTPASGEICAGQAPIVINGSIPSGGYGSYTYHWQENLTCDLSPTGTWTNIAVGGTQQNYTLMSPLNATRCFRRVAFDNSDCSHISNVAQIEVHPAIINNIIVNNQQICSGSTPNLLSGTQAFGGSGDPTYQWEESTDGIAFSPISGANGQNYQPGILVQTTYFRRIAISDPCPSDYSTPVMITVCDPITNNTITSNQTICQGTIPSIFTGANPAGACGIFSYQWQISTDATYPVFANISGAISPSYQAQAINTKTYFRRVITSVVSNCTVSASNEITIDIMPRPIPDAGFVQTITNGATANLTGTITGGTPVYSPQWTPLGSVQAPSNALNVTTVNLSASTQFILTVTDVNGCIGTDNVWVLITGSPLSVSLTANPSTICPNSPSQICANASGGTGTYIYSWTSPGNTYPSTQCINVNPGATTTYTCLVWDGFVSVSANVTLVVSPSPIIISPLSVEICSGEQLNYSPSSSIAGTNYIWTSTSGGTCSGNSNSAVTAAIIPDYLSNSGNTDCVVSYLITPVGPAPTFCPGQAETLEVTVKPVAYITNTVNSQTIVSGYPTSPETFNSSVASSGIHWKYSGTTCPGFVQFSEYEGYTPTIPSQTVSLLTGSPSTCTLNYDVRPFIVITIGDTCWGNPFTYHIVINSEPNKYDMICPVPICAGQSATISLTGSDVGINYMLYRGGTALPPSKPGTGMQLDWINLVVSGSYTIRATNPTNGQSNLMNGLCQVVINPLPPIFLLTALNGEHCAPVTLLLSGSQSGIDYLLIRNGDVNNPIQTLPGTGLPGFLVFSPVTEAGVYTVIANNPTTVCQRLMQGSVNIDAQIQQFAIFPGGILCAGDNLCIEGSEPGINYQLWLNNQPFGPVVPGDPNGASICFGSITNAGTYRIHAKNPLTNCELFFTESIVIHPLPNTYIISPVQGCAGTEIMLNNCQQGIHYYLYFTPGSGKSSKEAIAAGPELCSGGIINFGPWYDEGVYRIQAVDTITNCTAWMSGTTTIYPKPEIYSIIPQGPSCPPVNIALANYQLNATYYLYRNGDTLVASDNGANGSVDFGIQIQPGVYTVKAQFVFASGFECWNNMQGSVEIYPEPSKYTLLPAGPLCPPAALFLNGSDAGVTYTLWHNTYGIRQVMTGTGGVLHFQPVNQAGNYWVVAKSGDSCSVIMYNTVTVNSIPTVYHVLPQGLGLCEPAFVGLDGSEINTAYELLHADGTSLIPQELFTPSLSGSFWFNSPQQAGNYIVKATNSFGCNALMNGTAIVNSMPVVDAGPATDTICNPPSASVSLNGFASDYSTVQWTSPTNPGGSNFTSPNSLNTIYTFTALDLINQKVTLTLTASGNGICAGAHVSDSIIIHLLAPIIDAGVDQTKCINEPVQLNGAISGGATSGIWTTSGTGFFNNAGLLNAVYTPGAADQTSGTVTLTLTTTNSSVCPNLSDFMVISFYNQLSPGIASTDQILCNGETPSTLSSTIPSGGSGNFLYQWQFSTNAGSTWSDISSGGNALAYSPQALTVTTLYRLRQTDTYCNPDQLVYTNSVTISVHNMLTAGNAGSDQTICYGEAPSTVSATAPSGGSNTFIYQWQFSTDAGLNWVNVPSGGNTLSYSPSTLNVTTIFRLQQTDSYCIPYQMVYTNSVTITVHNILVAGIAGTDQTICYGETPSIIVASDASGGSGSRIYQWQFSTNGGSSWTDASPGGNTLIYSPGALNVSTVFRLRQTDTYCNPDQVVYTNHVTITVHNILFAGIASADQIICFGEAPAMLSATVPSGGSGVFLYQWQFSPNLGSTWTNVSSGGNDLTYSPQSLIVTTLYRLRQTDTYCNPDQVVYTNSVTISVHNVLTAGNAGSDQTICYGETPSTVSATAPSGGSSNFIYQWQFSTNAGLNWVNVPSGGNTLFYSPAALNITTQFRLRQTDVFCNPDQEVYTNSVTITVHNILVAGIAGSDQIICYGETPSVLSAANSSGGSGNVLLQWQFSINGGITWTDVSSGGNALNYSPGALTVTALFRLRQTDTYCNPNQIVYTNNVTIIVHNILTAGIAGTDQSICNGETPAALTATPPSGGSSIFLYQWQLSTDAGLTWSDISIGGNSLIYSPVALTVTTLFRLRQTDTFCTPDQVVYTNSLVVNVHNILSAGIASSDQTICYGAVPAMLSATAPTGGSGTFLYQWQFSTNAGLTWSDIYTGGNALEYSPSSLIVNTLFRLKQTDTYCNPDQIVYTNTVSIEIQVPTVNTGPNDTICGMIPYVLSQATANYAINYTWSTSGTGSFVGQFQLNSTYFPSPADMNTGNVILTLTISDQCNNVVSDNMVLTLSQLPVSYFSYSTPTCDNVPIHLNDQSSVSNGYIKMWVWDYGDGTHDTIHFPANPNVQHTFAPPGPAYLVKLTIVTSLGCTDDFQQLITTLSAPVANFYFSQVSCDNNPVQFTNSSQLNGSFGLQPWNWDFGDPTTGINNTSNLLDPIHQFSDSGTFIVRLIVKNYNNCLDTMVKQVHINPHPPVDFSYNTSCLSEPVYFDPDTNIMNVNAIGTWHWDFGDGVYSGMRNTLHVFTAPGTYTVSLTVTDTLGCESSKSHTILINPLPIAHFDAGSTNCAATMVHFTELTSTTTGYVVRWIWDFGDGNMQTVVHPDNPNVTHLYPNPGIYNATLMVIASDSCNNSETQAITIHPNPVANFDFSSACDSMPVSFSDLTQNNGGGNITQWHWNFGDPVTGVNNTSGIQNPNHVYSAPGQYTVQLIAWTANGCTDTISRQIVVKSKPPVDFTTQNNCQGIAVQFQPNNIVMNVNSIATWFWEFGDGGISTLPTPSYTYVTASIYMVKLTVTDTAGCINTITKPVTIAPQPISNFDYAQPACQETAVQFTDFSSTTVGYIVQRNWDFGDGNTQTVVFPENPNITHNYSSYGSFNVTLTISTNVGCTKTIIKTVVIAPNPLANFSFIAGCVNVPVEFSDLSQSGSGILTEWLWNFGDPTTGTANQSSLQNPDHTFSGPASYLVTLVVTNNGGCKDTIAKSLIVNILPIVDFTADESCSGDSTFFTSSVNAQIIAGQLWNFGDGITSTLNDPMHIYSSPGDFTVTLTITDTAGCTNSKTHDVTISYPPSALFQVTPSSCVNNPVFFDDISTLSNGQFTSWYWDFGDGQDTLIIAPSSPDIAHIYTAAGTFAVLLKVFTSQGCDDEFTQTITISESPTSEFSFGNTCVSEAVSFTNLASTNGGMTIIDYFWDFGDPGSGINNFSSLPNPMHVYANIGSYLATLIVTNAGGCNDTISHTVIINPKPTVDFSWINTCLGTITDFAVDTVATNVPSVQAFDWDFGDGTPHSALQNPSHLYTVAETYTATLTIIDTTGCTNSKSYSFTIQPHPVASFIHSSICMNNQVAFTDQSFSPGGEPITGWFWDFGITGVSNDTSTAQHPYWTYTSVGNYFVSLIVTTQSGCADSVTIPLQVLDLPNAAFTYKGSPCSNGSITFLDSSFSQQTSIVGWLWEFVPGVFSSIQNPVYGFPYTDSCYNVRLIITDNKGCRDTTEKPVCVSPQLVINFEYTPTCYRDTTYFSTMVVTPAGSSLVAYDWNFGDPSSGANNISGLRDPAHYYSKPGTYTVIFKTTDINHCEAQKILFVIVKPLPEPKFNYQSGVCDSTIYFNGFHTDIGNDIISWHWTFGDGSDTLTGPSSGTTLTHKYMLPGDYSPSLTITNSDGCTNTYTESILMKPCIQAYFDVINTLVCQNYTIFFSENSFSGIPITEWEWNFGDNTTSQSFFKKPDQISHTFDQPGYFMVRLLVKTEIGSVEVLDSTSTVIYVKPSPIAEFDASGECLGDSIIFANLSLGNGTILTSYKWIFNDPITSDSSSLENPVHFYPIAGDYMPDLIVGNSIGCTDTISHSVSVYSPPKAQITVKNPCIGQPTRFLDKTNPGSSELTKWNWSITNDKGYWQLDSMQNPVIVFELTGDYSAQLIVSDVNGCGDTITQPINELPSPESEFSYVERIEDQQWQLVITNESKKAESYQWDFGNGKNSMATDPVTTYDEEGEYLIKLVSQNSDMCTDTLTKEYHLLFKGLYIPNAFVPEDPKGKLNIFQPKGEGLQTFNIEVYDKWGNILWTSTTEKLVDGHPGPGWDGKYEGGYAPIGVYIWKVSAVFKDGSVWTGQSLGDNKNLSGFVYGTLTLIR